MWTYGREWPCALCSPAPCSCDSESQDGGSGPEAREGEHRARLRGGCGLQQRVDGHKDHQPQLEPLVDAAVQVPGLGSRLRAAPHSSIGHLLFQGVCSNAGEHATAGTAGLEQALQQSMHPKLVNSLAEQATCSGEADSLSNDVSYSISA